MKVCLSAELQNMMICFISRALSPHSQVCPHPEHQSSYENNVQDHQGKTSKQTNHWTTKVQIKITFELWVISIWWNNNFRGFCWTKRRYFMTFRFTDHQIGRRLVGLSLSLKIKSKNISPPPSHYARWSLRKCCLLSGAAPTPTLALRLRPQILPRLVWGVRSPSTIKLFRNTRIFQVVLLYS